jgi:hypothetical protein
VKIVNNHFGATTPTGFYALRANVGQIDVTGNVFDQGVAFDSPVQQSGCGNTTTGSFSIPAALLQPC